MKNILIIIPLIFSLFCLFSQSFAGNQNIITVFSLLLNNPPISTCNNANVTNCNNEQSCNNVGGYWFDSNWGCIANQGIRSYVDNGDGTISDTINGLMWQNTDGKGSHWNEAKTYCENLTLGLNNYSDWRLPTKNELKNLVICTNGTSTPLQEPPNTSINCDGTNSFPYPPSGNYNVPTIPLIFQSHSSNYWSSTMTDSGPGYVYSVDFVYGSALLSSTNSYGYVRCVR